VDLNVVNATATPEQKAAAEKAQPAAQGLFDDDEKPKAAAGAAVVKISDAKPQEKKPQEKKKGSGGVYAGVAIAVLGVAAAFAITKMNKPAPQQPTAVVEQNPAAQPPGAQETPQPSEKAPVAAVEPTPQPAGEPGEVAAPTGGGEKVAAAPGNGTAGAQQPTGGSAAAPADEKTPDATEKPSTAPAAPDAPSKPGDLKGAMAAAVGGDGTKKDTPTAEQAEPAAGSRNQNIPEQPPQGSVQAAIRAVMPAAKACVAGADDVSRAQVTFASNGTVKSVSVSGWAASHNATGCVKSALQGANVGPFSKSTFTTGFPIRP
jgi:hypothetical protein